MAADANYSEDPSAPSSGPECFQILALDGDGAKAHFSAHVLARLEEDLGVRVYAQHIAAPYTAMSGPGAPAAITALEATR